MKEILSKLGLEPKEIQVYIALLKLKKSSVNNIKKQTHIERTHIYKILERLQDKNFTTSIIENNVKVFTPITPTKLLKRLDQTRKELKGLLPGLEKLSLKKESSKVSIYRGKQGLKQLEAEEFPKIKEYFVIGEQGKFQEAMPFYSQKLMKKLEEYKITEKVLVEHGKKVIESKHTQVRYLPKGLKFPSTTVIFKNKVLTIIWDEPLIIATESRAVVESHISQFKALWKMSKK